MADVKMTEEEKIEAVNKIYASFLARVKKIETEGYSKLGQIVKEADEEKLRKIRLDINNN